MVMGEKHLGFLRDFILYALMMGTLFFVFGWVM